MREDRVFVAYHQYALIPSGADTAMVPLADPPNGLVVAAGGAAAIRAGLHTGWITVQGETFDGPPSLDPGMWDDIVDVSLRVDSEFDGLETCDAEYETSVVIGNLLPVGSGWCRLRVSVRGRDAGWAADSARHDDAPIEVHRLQVWRAPEAEEVRHKLTDGVGERLRASVAARVSDSAQRGT